MRDASVCFELVNPAVEFLRTTRANSALMERKMTLDSQNNQRLSTSTHSSSFAPLSSLECVEESGGYAASQLENQFETDPEAP